MNERWGKIPRSAIKWGNIPRVTKNGELSRVLLLLLWTSATGKNPTMIKSHDSSQRWGTVPRVDTMGNIPRTFSRMRVVEETMGNSPAS